jgi:alkylation response protein AidB-like acyl-CoA dehydrogenase
VSHEVRQWISYEALAEAAGAEAVARDRDGAFPRAAFDGLRRLGVIGNPPLRPDEASQLFRALAAVGRGDLSVGRIFEGHVNALFLIHMFGRPEQRAQYQTLAAGGALFGVWNTDAPAFTVTLDDGHLRGKKSFASGADGLSFAVITASTPRGRQMAVIAVSGRPVDRNWWQPLGMRASGSHLVDFAGVPVWPANLLGEPDDYVEEPWFTAGAVRFAAVHVGGMHAILDTVVTHLRRRKRAADPHQQHRVGLMATEVATGYAWLDHAARYWAKIERQIERQHCDRVLAPMSAARTAIERAALHVLELAERSVGAAGMIAPHPLERLLRDLRTYLRQPNPDAALAAVGAAATEGLWSPDAHGDDLIWQTSD